MKQMFWLISKGKINKNELIYKVGKKVFCKLTIPFTFLWFSSNSIEIKTITSRKRISFPASKTFDKKVKYYRNYFIIKQIIRFENL